MINPPSGLSNNFYLKGRQIFRNRSHHPFFKQHVTEFNSEEHISISLSDDEISIPEVPENKKLVIFLNVPLNKIHNINEYLFNINSSVPIGTLLLGFSEVSEQNKSKILRRYPAPLNNFLYTFNFLVHRVMPKISRVSKKIYQALTKNKIHILHSSELLGRIASEGFSISEFGFIDHSLFFTARKTAKRIRSNSVSTGLIFSMPRIGKNGKQIRVYKLRTMHAFAEYLQDFVMQRNGIASDGKFKDDFRVASWGKFLRKYWIDELPMLINLFKGEIKLVGTRPLSEKFLQLYPEDVKQLRLKVKPGFMPASYASTINSLDEIIDLERIYLLQYQKHPFLTDATYCLRILCNLARKNLQSR